MPIAEIVTGLGGVKTALDILKALKGTTQAKPILGEIAELQSALIDANHGLLAAGQTQAADADRIRALETEVARLEKWDGDKENYELKGLVDGAVAYMLKPGARGSEPPHWLCPTCFQAGQIGILQSQGRKKDIMDAPWLCPNCKNGFAVHWSYRPQWID